MYKDHLSGIQKKYVQLKMQKKVVWVKPSKYFWFGLPFGSPNPTSDLVTDDDDSSYVL